MASLYAISITELGFLIKVAALFTVAAVAGFQLRQLSYLRTLTFSHSEKKWTLTTPEPAPDDNPRDSTMGKTTGNLIAGGYRSAALLVLAIQHENTQLHRIAVWRDQVTPVQFSFLHYQLAYGTEPATRRTARAYARLFPVNAKRNPE